MEQKENGADGKKGEREMLECEKFGVSGDLFYRHFNLWKKNYRGTKGVDPNLRTKERAGIQNKKMRGNGGGGGGRQEVNIMKDFVFASR